MTYTRVKIGAHNVADLYTLYSSVDDTEVKTAISNIFPFIDFSTNLWSYVNLGGSSSYKEYVISYRNVQCIILRTTAKSASSIGDSGMRICTGIGTTEYWYSSNYGFLSCELYDNGSMILTLTASTNKASITDKTNHQIAIFPKTSENNYNNIDLNTVIFYDNNGSMAYDNVVNFPYSRIAHVKTAMATSSDSNNYNLTVYPDTNISNSVISTQPSYTGDKLILSSVVGFNPSTLEGVAMNGIYKIDSFPNQLRGNKYIKYNNTAWRVVYFYVTDWNIADTSQTTITTPEYWDKNSYCYLVDTGEEFTSAGDVTGE